MRRSARSVCPAFAPASSRPSVRFSDVGSSAAQAAEPHKERSARPPQQSSGGGRRDNDGRWNNNARTPFNRRFVGGSSSQDDDRTTYINAINLAGTLKSMAWPCDRGATVQPPQSQLAPEINAMRGRPRNAEPVVPEPSSRIGAVPQQQQHQPAVIPARQQSAFGRQVGLPSSLSPATRLSTCQVTMTLGQMVALCNNGKWPPAAASLAALFGDDAEAAATTCAINLAPPENATSGQQASSGLNISSLDPSSDQVRMVAPPAPAATIVVSQATVSHPSISASVGSVAH